MSTFDLRRFSNPATLQAIHPVRLLSFLRPYKSFFTARDVELPDVQAANKLDYARLVEALMSPGPDTPQELIDALYYVHEMATAVGMDALLDAAQHGGIAIETRPDQTPADVAIQMWNLDRELVQEKHAEQFLERPRTFEYYQSTPRAPRFKAPTAGTLRALEQQLDDWFDRKRRGRGVRVFPFDRDEAVWFLIRHGSPYRREGSLRDGNPSSVHYRPVTFDVVVYDRRIGEMRIKAGSKGEKTLYRRAFGEHVFGNVDYFPDASTKYNLEPLRRDGRAALVCIDVPGLERIHLKELQLYRGGAYGEIEIRKASDVFAVYESRLRQLPERPRIIRASFEVKFEDSRRTRTVTIKPPNIAQYTRDGDGAMIEEWLTKRGFVVPQERGFDEGTAAAVAGA